MIIDFHSHLSPPHWRESRPMPAVLTDLDGFFVRKEEDGIDLTVISNAMINLPGAKFDNLALDQIQAWNEFAHDLVASHPGKLVAQVGVNPFGGPEMLDELEQAVRDGGFKGVTVNSSVDGEFLDSPTADDFWALVDELDVPVFVHPPSIPPAGGRLADPRVLEYAGRASDVALSVAAAIFAAVLERHPGVKLVCATGGGGLAMLAGRLDVAHEYGGTGPPRPGAGPPAPPAQLTKRPSSYLSQVHVDTCSYSVPALLCNLEVLGADHVLFGTDFPPIDVPASVTIELVRSLPISDEDKERILWRNAASLLKIESLIA